MIDFRMGHGYDVHRFATEASAHTQRLGGVDVPVDFPLLAHSDGDVVLHALIDAILGAMAMGDIGTHFPDNDPAWANADSGDLLGHIWQTVSSMGYAINNIDLTVVAQTPRLQAYKTPMAVTIATLLNTTTDRVNVKATTTEQLGFVGRKEGIASYAVVTLVKAA
ncbi:MAG: 2-C-methyl-D-erythritol 2,4-cyclodiphosphate synthase [Natronospirillum sp.]